MKLYSSISKKSGQPIISSCLSAEDCILTTVKKINELGIVKSIYPDAKCKAISVKFRVIEFEEIMVDGEIDYTDSIDILEMELIVRKKEA